VGIGAPVVGGMLLASSQKLQKYRQFEVEVRGKISETTDKEELTTMQRRTCKGGNGDSNGGATACQYLTTTGILVVIACSRCEKYDYNLSL
jgi:hypothetical protein